MYRLVIADDESLTRISIQNIIVKHFSEIEIIGEAANGKKAVELAEEADIVIMDIEMPLISGIEASRRIKQQNPDCKIIFLTAYAKFDYARQAISLGATDFLLKPIDEYALVMSLKKVLFKIEGKNFVKEQQAKNVLKDYIHPDVLQTDFLPNDRMGKIMKDAKEYIDENYTEEISVDTIAQQFQLSPNYFNKMFKQYFKMSCMEYIIYLRIACSQKLLENPELTIKEVGTTVGYGDPNYFSKIFKKRIGLTPTEYRNQLFFS